MDMNTEQMVSVPREMVESAADWLEIHSTGPCVERNVAEDLRAILSQPAAQHQGEPVALAIPEECPHLIVFDDTEVASLIFSGAGARVAALKKWEAISTSWNAHLFVRVARNSRDDGHLCATAADFGEVERLLADIALRDRELEIAAEAHGEIQEERDTLRSQLAERDALLEESYREGWNDGQEAIEQRHQSTPRTSTEGWGRFKADNALSTIEGL
ncbi:hypothetical protein D3C80_448570 [compost metagenome]